MPECFEWMKACVILTALAKRISGKNSTTASIIRRPCKIVVHDNIRGYLNWMQVKLHLIFYHFYYFKLIEMLGMVSSRSKEQVLQNRYYYGESRRGNIEDFKPFYKLQNSDAYFKYFLSAPNRRHCSVPCSDPSYRCGDRQQVWTIVQLLLIFPVK
jgi:hypothetical protein